jgi:hypothetical protein
LSRSLTDNFNRQHSAEAVNPCGIPPIHFRLVRPGF